MASLRTLQPTESNRRNEDVMFLCETCGATSPEECRCANVGMSPMVNGQPPSLDVLAAEVRECCRDEARVGDEAHLLYRLAGEASDRHRKLTVAREDAERRMRAAYNEAVTP